MIIVKILIVFLFASFVFIDSISVLPRLVGSNQNSNSLGSSLQIMANTVKRFCIVLLAPMVGFITITDSLEALIFLIIICFLTSIFIFIFTSYNHHIIKFFFENMLKIILDRDMSFKKIISFFIKSFSNNCNDNFNLKIFDFSKENCNKDVRFISGLIFLMYVNVVFIINIISMSYPGSSAIILQMSGVFTSLGTIMMAFWLDPILSRSFDTKIDSYKNVQSFLQGKIIGLFFSFLIYMAAYIFIISN